MPYGPMGPENPLAASNPMGQIYNPIAGNKYPMNPMYKNPIVYNPRAPAQLPQYYRTNADQEMYGQQYQGYPK